MQPGGERGGDDRAARGLAVVLVVTGCVTLAALPAALMPHAWMRATHAAAGLGEMPEGPVVEYLARSASLLYAFVGAMSLALARDVRRHRPAIRVATALAIPWGVGMVPLDLVSGMPAWWAWFEGPAVAGLGLLGWTLAGRVRERPGAGEEGRP